MYCPNCGRRISANSRFCPYCGASIKSNLSNLKQSTFQGQSNNRFSANYPHRNQSYSMSERYNHKKIIWVILAVIIIILAGFGYHHYKQSPMSVNLATVMPGHVWKTPESDINDSSSNGRFYKPYFGNHSISHSPCSVKYGKSHIKIKNKRMNIMWQYKLKKIKGNTYYFVLDKEINNHDSNDIQEVYFSGNVLKYVFDNGDVDKFTRHGDKVTRGSKVYSLNKMLKSKYLKIQAEYLAHKPYKMVKE